MTDSNVVSIIGRLTNDCEISKGSNGNTYGRFSIAVNRSYQANGDWHDETSFFDCSMFGDICTTKGPYLQKGKRVSIIGSLRQSRWEKDGKKMSKVEILVNQVQFLDVNNSNKKDDGKAEVSISNPSEEIPAEVISNEIPF